MTPLPALVSAQWKVTSSVQINYSRTALRADQVYVSQHCLGPNHEPTYQKQGPSYYSLPSSRGEYTPLKRSPKISGIPKQNSRTG